MRAYTCAQSVDIILWNLSILPMSVCLCAHISSEILYNYGETTAFYRFDKVGVVRCTRIYTANW